MAAAVRVIEGRKEVALPQQHQSVRLAHRRPRRRIGVDAPDVLLIGGSRHEVIGLGGVETAVVGSVGPGHDGLGLEHLDWHLVARFGLDRADQVVLEGKLVHHHQPVRGADDVDGSWVHALLEAKGSAARGHDAKARHALASPLDDRLPPQGAEEGYRLRREGSSVEILTSIGPPPISTVASPRLSPTRMSPAAWAGT